jgi:LmbE family N-acetylglucosaminyl deacetylase
MAVVLVVSPHAMDEALGCGGTMARHVEAGDKVETLVLFGDGSGMDAKRRLAAPAAAAVLSSAPPRFVGMPENRSDTLPLVDVIAAIEKAVAELLPQTLYVPHGGNLNIDHQTAFRAALTAARPVPGAKVRAIYAYEVPSSTEWAPVGVSPPFLPTRFVDITATLPKKMRALDCYAAELRDAPHSRSVAGIRALAQLRGHNAGMTAAEAFMVVREIV